MADTETVTRTVLKTVEISVDLRPQDMLHGLPHEELRQECSKRGIEPKRSGPGGLRPKKIKIDCADLNEVNRLIMKRNFGEALLALEWLLPKEFRGFAGDVATHFGGRP